MVAVHDQLPRSRKIQAGRIDARVSPLHHPPRAVRLRRWGMKFNIRSPAGTAYTLHMISISRSKRVIRAYHRGGVKSKYLKVHDQPATIREDRAAKSTHEWTPQHTPPQAGRRRRWGTKFKKRPPAGTAHTLQIISISVSKEASKDPSPRREVTVVVESA